MRNFRFACFIFFLLTAYCFPLTAQIPQATMVQIVRAEDELRFDKDLQDLLKSPDALTRRRAALAAGRIGNAKAVPFLADLLEKDANEDVRVMAAFALGEVEAKTGVDAVLRILAKKDEANAIRARTLEAAGKIAAAIATTDKEKSAELGKAILNALETEHLKTAQNREVILLGLTAALRAKPDGTDVAVAKFLSDKDARVRADALNTLVRLRAKSDNLKERYRALLKDSDPIVRANAARAIGSSEDANALDLLIETVTKDSDQRVRVAAIRSLAALKNKTAAESLVTHGEKLLTAYKTEKTKKVANPAEKNELLEIATTLGRLLQNSNDKRASDFLKNLNSAEGYISPESQIALVRVSANVFIEDYDQIYNRTLGKFPNDWQLVSATAQAMSEISNLESNNENEKLKIRVQTILSLALSNYDIQEQVKSSKKILFNPVPDLIQAAITFKPKNVNSFLGARLQYRDAIVRITAAELLGEQPVSKENVEALKTAFAQSLEKDTDSNDATLAILSALVKLDKNEAKGSLQSALNHTDFLVRRQAATLIRQNGLEKDFPNLDEQVGTVKLMRAGAKSKLGVVLNNEADYIRAVSRKNGQTRAVLTTEKGTFTIDLLPEDAPLTVDNFVQLAKKNYFNGIAFHRVVPNFVVQGGDPRGDGNGGPGWQIRCEINMVEYERGAVGMALSGKDTGGSQWFVTHSPQPHLDGGYTVFGKVNETDMKIVDSIARGDKILSVKIFEGNQPQRMQGT
jgi:cyclophilin family peptidyl-prolyl cis-trans isomerase/HEAT repeat protein